ncbi:MAG: ABC transporter ATP-binding protein [Clostridia bacterium]|nr:ABC transporter ATP-binding protein [Clostridia bacterium]
MNNGKMRRPGGPGGPGGHGRPKAKKGTFKRVLKCLFEDYKGMLIVKYVLIAVFALVSVAPAIYINQMVRIMNDGLDLIRKQGMTPADALEKMMPIILTSVGIMLCIYVIGLLAAFFHTRLGAIITQGFLYTMRRRMFNHMQSLPVKYFDTHNHGDVMSHYTNDIDTLRQLVSQSLPAMFQSILTVVVLFAVMLSYSLWLTLVVIVGVIAMSFVTKFIGGNSAKYFMKQQRSIGRTEGFVEEMMNGQKVIKVFCHEEQSKKDFDEINGQLCDDATKANRFANIMMPIMGNIGNVLYVLTAFVGGAVVISGIFNPSLAGIFTGETVLDVAIVAAFMGMTRQFTQQISQLSQQTNSIIMALAGADRIFTMLDEEPEADEGYVTLVNAREVDGEIVEVPEHTGMWAWKHPHKAEGTVTYTKMQGDIVFDNVDFSYDGEKLVLEDIRLYAEPGQKVALVGATGAGKTTITNLINRFYDLADGKVRYDGININKIKKDDLRRSLGVVLQDVSLFTGTVMENLRYGRLDATDEDCIAAAKLANADGFIRMLPDGYNTMLTGGGAGLSQGQRQLISIARAAVADPPVMILDEATSSIDTMTEEIVQKGMDALMKGRTVFVIAHRLSTVKNSDVIMVLDHGRIIERGSHDKLIAERGTYYKLYTGAFELE